MVDERLGRLKKEAIDESKELLKIFLYLWVLLSLFSLHKALIFNEDILTYQQGFAIINALALGQGDSVKFGITRRTSARPCSCRPGTARLLWLERARRISIF